MIGERDWQRSTKMQIQVANLKWVKHLHERSLDTCHFAKLSPFAGDTASNVTKANNPKISSPAGRLLGI